MPDARLAVHATTADPDVIEMCAWAGADAYVVDLEHGPAGIAESVQGIRAAQAAGIETHFRVGADSLGLASRLVDAGADCIYVADARRRADGERAARALLHPPLGGRGHGGCRRNHYALSASTGLPPSDDSASEPVVGLQIESREGLEHLDSILLAPGLGVVSVGTRDLAADLGLPGQMSHPAVEAAVARVAERAVAHGLAFAEMARSGRLLQRALDRGASWILVPLAAVLRAGLEEFRPSARPAPRSDEAEPGQSQEA